MNRNGKHRLGSHDGSLRTPSWNYCFHKILKIFGLADELIASKVKLVHHRGSLMFRPPPINYLLFLFITTVFFLFLFHCRYSHLYFYYPLTTCSILYISIGIGYRNNFTIHLLHFVYIVCLINLFKKSYLFIYLLAIRKNTVYKIMWRLYNVRCDSMN